MKKVSVIIPVYNEENTIDELLSRVTQTHITGIDLDIIVVDDGSTDGTCKKLKKWESQCTVLSSSSNQGKGSAIQIGLKHAKGEIFLIQDADLEYNPADYESLLRPFNDGRVQIVYGSRFLGPHLSTMFVYSLGNKFVTFVTNVLYNTNITDMETGYKVFRKSVLNGMKLNAKKFDFEPEFTAKALKAGYQIYEIPISYFGRKFIEGKKLTWRDGVSALITLIKYRFVN